MYVGNGARWRMSWVMPPGIAARARSASAAERGCLARYSSWIVMGSMITLCSRLRRDAEQRHQRRVRVEGQPVHGRLAPPRDAVARARRHARGDEPALVVRGVEQRPAGETAQVGDDAVGAPVRDAGPHAAGPTHERNDARAEGGGAPT